MSVTSLYYAAVGKVEGTAAPVGFGTDRSPTDVCFGGGFDTRVDDYLPFITAHVGQ